MKIIMPHIGMSMSEGKITRWYVNNGDQIKEGEPLLDVETEKLTSTVDSPATGIFKAIANVGDIIACDAEIAEIET